jgi:uncharacterized C2H2 Zn-finger protein
MPRAATRHDDHPNRVYFRCPGCDEVFRQNNPEYAESTIRLFGSHCVDVNRWSFNGDFEKPTFSPSVLVTGGEHETRCHSFVRDGRIEYLGDCTHPLAGQTVDLPEMEANNA